MRHCGWGCGANDMSSKQTWRMPSVDPFSLIPQTEMKPRVASAQLGYGRRKDFAPEVCSLNFHLPPVSKGVYMETMLGKNANLTVAI